MRVSIREAAPALASFAAAFVLLCAPAAFSGQAGKAPPTDVTTAENTQCVVGCEGFKNGAMGTMTVQANTLRFGQEKKKAEIGIASIQDIYLGNESRQDITGAGKVVTMAIPYGGGRFLSLFSHKVEVMTVEYVDANGAFHGAVFVLPAGHATYMKKTLVAQGAKTTEHVPEPEPKEEKKP